MYILPKYLRPWLLHSFVEDGLLVFTSVSFAKHLLSDGI